MTKQEWLDCNNLETLLKEVTSKRKNHLFALACCRRVEHLMFDQRSKDCLTKLDLFIDGKIGKKELESVVAAARAAADAIWAADARNAANAALASVWCDVRSANAAAYAANDKQAERLKQFELLRDIYNPNLLTLKFSDQAISLAQQVYNRDDKARGILSDYLEDEGYPVEIVSHLKSGFHPKGCWLIDQILGKI